MRFQRLIDMVDNRDVLGVVHVAAGQQAGAAQKLGHVLIALFGQRYLAGFLVQVVIVLGEVNHHRVDRLVHLRQVLGGARDDQRRARLVDEDGVHFVDDGEGVAALGHRVQRVFHVVAQVIEAELIVGAIGNVGAIGLAAFLVGQAVDDAAHAQPQKPVDLAHPIAVALGQVVIDRHHMHAFAGQRVEICGKGGHQGLAFTGLHFGDGAGVQHHAAD